MTGASINDHTRSEMPAIDNPSPARSIFGARGSREFGTSQIAPTTAAITIGTFTRNTDPHEKCSRSQPPEIGPSATPTPVTAVQIPIAAAHSRASLKTFTAIASVVGKIRAAPRPVERARRAISCPVVVASAPAAENDPERDQAGDQRAACVRIGRPGPPAARSKPAKTRV